MFGFVVGDVAGKGPPAALLAARMQGILAASANASAARHIRSRSSTRNLAVVRLRHTSPRFSMEQHDDITAFILRYGSVGAAAGASAFQGVSIAVRVQGVKSLS
jgi:hypothetical protein